MVGNVTLQPVQVTQQLGSVKESMENTQNSFSSLLLGMSGETVDIDVESLPELEELFGSLVKALNTEDLQAFLKEVNDLDPTLKQMFMMFDAEEMKDMTVNELLMSAGVSEETVGELENMIVELPAFNAEELVPGEQDENTEVLSTVIHALFQQLAVNEGTVKTDVSGDKSQLVHDDLAKLALLTKGLALIDPKKSAGTEKSQLQQNMSDVLETIEKLFKSAVRDLEAPLKQEVLKQTSVIPEPLKSETGMLNLQTLQLQSGPVKWSLNPPLRQSDSAQQLMQQFQNVMQKANFGKVNGTEKLMIRLQPEHLGTLKIELMQKDGMMTARIIASTVVAKEMIDSQLNQLRQSFSAQNLQVEKIEIMQAQTSENRLDKDGEKHQENNEKREKQHEQQDQPDDEQVSFHDIFLNIEV
ncbi:flagellar hook-length control protein FliK [Jeotgalibacillus salarius]|uniref:Flagellar hook-length control protein-like C-terminal domain-containing protein n=1 Tax=Jeotgalibacillus salarius TaxID=546023 RepID=A0A4Y8LMU4_9BACL|nr:flagellar hook-length control protein FliK [Jeotgalibacillus salarius]TFE02761.1 hypothetical protein E2626_02865 [Jeotgalibacillus salarius]